MKPVTNSRLQCANCQILIGWLPEVADKQTYCCVGCANGGPCTCDYGRLPKTEDKYAIVLSHSCTIPAVFR